MDKRAGAAEVGASMPVLARLFVHRASVLVILPTRSLSLTSCTGSMPIRSSERERGLLAPPTSLSSFLAQAC